VAAEMAAMAPGILQLNPFAWIQKLTKYVKDGQPKKAIQLFHENARRRRHVKFDEGQKALELFQQMQQEGV